MLRTGSIKSPRTPEDGVRISVMSRHTLNDGLTPDPEITPDSYDDWLPWLGPTPYLLGSYYKRGVRWEEFARRYKTHLETEHIAHQVKELGERALATNITLLCIEETPEKCHRRLLAEEAKLLVPELIISIA